MLFSGTLPADNATLRQKLYAGEIFKTAPTSSSLETIAHINEIITKELGLPLEAVHERLSEKEFLEKMRDLRLAIVESPVCRDYARRLMTEFGFSIEQNAFDVIRLRSVLHNSHLNPALARAYSLHRDTWYANPQCQINWWIALHDVPEEQAFSFYPARFNRKVENTSAAFDYNQWMNKVGWQSTRSQLSVDYPRALQVPPAEERQSFSCRAGEILLFSAANLHQTNPNATGLSRFSIDFRTVHLDDHSNHKGAPNADNGSRPEALQDYIFPNRRSA